MRRQDLISADPGWRYRLSLRARERRQFTGRDFEDGSFDETGRLVVIGEQRRDFAAQFFIARAGFIEERRARIRLALQRRVIKLFDLLPAFRRHVESPGQVQT